MSHSHLPDEVTEAGMARGLALVIGQGGVAGWAMCLDSKLIAFSTLLHSCLF